MARGFSGEAKKSCRNALKRRRTARRSALLGRQDCCGLDTCGTRRKAQGPFPGWTPGNTSECGNRRSGQPRLTPRSRRRKGQSNSSRHPKGCLELFCAAHSARDGHHQPLEMRYQRGRWPLGRLTTPRIRQRSPEQRAREDLQTQDRPRREASPVGKTQRPRQRQGRCVVYQAAVGAFTRRYRLAIPGAGDEVVLTDS